MDDYRIETRREIRVELSAEDCEVDRVVEAIARHVLRMRLESIAIRAMEDSLLNNKKARKLARNRIEKGKRRA